MSGRGRADIEYTRDTNDEDREQDCVVAECQESGDTTGPIWGHGEASVKRALATLTEECSCGASFHFDADGDDE